MKTVVNSWNEWDPLRHVIVGHADVYRESSMEDYFSTLSE